MVEYKTKSLDELDTIEDFKADKFLHTGMIQKGINDICDYFDSHKFTLPDALQVVGALKSSFDVELAKRVNDSTKALADEIYTINKNQ